MQSSGMANNTEDFYPFKPTRKPGEHYKASVAIIWCFDDGFSNVLDGFIKARGWKWKDVLKEVGGVKTLVSPAEEAHRATLVWKLQSSLRLHKPTTVVLMLHSDCGAYGGLGAFGNDFERERENHEKDLRAAKEYIGRRLPSSVSVEMWLSGFDGLHRVE